MDVAIGQVWKDKDSRESNRYVRVDSIEGGRVTYIQCHPNGQPLMNRLTSSSRAERFPKAFRFVR